MALRAFASEAVRALGIKPSISSPAQTQLLQSLPAFFSRGFATGIATEQLNS